MRKYGKDATKCGQKAHIQHAVGFVEDQNFHLPQVDQVTGDEILQASGGGNDETRAGAHRCNLRFFRKAADNQSRLRQVTAAEFLVLSIDLHGQLARG